jgi:hypothetical protein
MTILMHKTFVIAIFFHFAKNGEEIKINALKVGGAVSSEKVTNNSTSTLV